MALKIALPFCQITAEFKLGCVEVRAVFVSSSGTLRLKLLQVSGEPISRPKVQAARDTNLKQNEKKKILGVDIAHV